VNPITEELIAEIVADMERQYPNEHVRTPFPTKDWLPSASPPQAGFGGTLQ